jgi:hypothetical protein
MAPEIGKKIIWPPEEKRKKEKKKLNSLYPMKFKGFQKILI